MDKIKVMTIFGTRPEAIKMCPLVLELRSRPEIECIVCLTAQHRQMLDSVMEIFGIEGNYDLDIMRDRQTLSGITVRIISKLDELLEEDGGMDSSALTLTSVHKVSTGGLQSLEAGTRPEGQSPVAFTKGHTSLMEFGGQIVVIAEEASGFEAKGHSTGTSKRGYVQQAGGLIVFLSPGKGIGKNKAAFGIGIHDLDGLAVLSHHDITGLHHAIAAGNLYPSAAGDGGQQHTLAKL